ncbi:MAG: molybdenum cofactor biosynthesis protein MoaE [Pseudomonadota bacterium]
MNDPDIHISVQAEDFNFGAEYQRMTDELGERVGAVVGFVGLVRDRNNKAGDGSAVTHLTLEHYPGMTEKSMQAIVLQAHERWPLLATRVVHRVGTLAPGAQIVLVLVASAHRDAAFAGAEFVMDYLKTDAVFWKREATSAGATWIASTEDDRQRRTAWDEQAVADGDGREKTGDA